MNNNILKFTLVAIAAAVFLTRILLIGIIPAGLTNDEADIGYDAYSILVTGHDQWGKFIPFTSFKGFGDYRLPLYTYLVVPTVKIFGLNAFAVRLPSVIFGLLSVMLMYFVAKKLFEKENYVVSASLAAMLLMSISPWHIGISRIGIESNVAITFLLLGILFLLHSLRKPFFIFLSFFFFMLTIYTYTAYSFFTPITLIILGIFYKKNIFKMKKQASLAFLIFLVLTIPLFLSHSTAGVRTSQVSFINSQDNVGLLANLNDLRGSCTEKFLPLLCKVSFNKYILFTNTFMRNYLNHFSFNFLYLGGTTTQYSILPSRSLFYTVELIFFVFGLITIIKRKTKESFLLFVLLLISPIPDSITGDGHYSRASVMIPFVLLVEAIGAGCVWIFLSSQIKKLILYARYLIFVLLMLSFASFSISYFSYFPKYYSSFSQYGYEPWVRQIEINKSKYDKIILSKYKHDTKQYVYYLFYTKYNPEKFVQKTSVEYKTDSTGWISVNKIDNLYFTNRIPLEKELRENARRRILLVSHPHEFPEKVKDIGHVIDKNGNVIFKLVDSRDLLEAYDLQKNLSAVQ